jgi:ornithine cyclodeaminase
MPAVFGLDEIKGAIDEVAVIDAVESAFVAYSRGEADVPPVGLLHFDDPPGDVHIKYGAIRGGDIYVVKVASGFYDCSTRGGSPSCAPEPPERWPHAISPRRSSGSG